MTINKEELSKNIETITAMTVDEFQTICENHKVPSWEIDHMVYDLAKAITLSEEKKNGR
jgi:hypothetical protein